MLKNRMTKIFLLLMTFALLGGCAKTETPAPDTPSPRASSSPSPSVSASPTAGEPGEPEEPEAELEEQEGERTRTYSLDDFDGWWYQDEDDTGTYRGRILHIDAKAGTYAEADKYGNEWSAVEASYDSENDVLLLHDEYWDPIELYFGEDGDMDVLWYDNWRTDEEGPLYFRGEPLTPPVISLEGMPGRWYMNGITDGDDVSYIDFSEDGTYITSEGSSGAYSLALRSTEYYHGYEFDYLSLSMETESADISDDRLIIGITYYLDDEFDARGEPAYGGRNLYIHESNIGTPEVHEAIQRFQLFEYDWQNKDENSLRFSRSDQVHLYRQNEYGWFPDKAGVWTYEDGVLTITWNEVFTDNERVAADSVVVDECSAPDVEDGFTLPSLGRFDLVEYN